MAAAVCGKRSYFEDASSPTAAAYKRFRRCSSSFANSPRQSSPVDQVNAMFRDNLYSAAPVNAQKEFQVSDDPVDLIVEEMKNATSVDDAKSRAARVLDHLSKSIRAQLQAAHKDDDMLMMLRQQNEALVRDNAILKRAVAIQHQRQKEFEDNKSQELKQLEARYLEQMQTLEMNNYALTLQLRLAQHTTNSAIIDNGRFNPDVF